MRDVFVLLIGFVLVDVATPDALGQESRSFLELQQVLQAGDQVRITEVSGIATNGKVAKLSHSALVLAANGSQHSFPSSRVLEIDRTTKDSVLEGMAVGTLIGFGSGAALVAIACNASYSNCRNHTGGVVVALGISAGIGAGIGALIDAGDVKREIVYRASKQTSRLYITPYLARRSKGLQLLVRF